MGEGAGAAVSDETQTTSTGPSAPPATSAEEAATQAREIRTRLDQDLKVLEARLPEPAALQARAKTIGGLAVGGGATVGAVVLAMKRRSASQAEEKAARKQAEALAAALPDAALELHRTEVTVAGRAGRLGLVVALLALAVAVWSKVSGGGEPEPDIWGPPA